MDCIWQQLSRLAGDREASPRLPSEAYEPTIARTVHLVSCLPAGSAACRFPRDPRLCIAIPSPKSLKRSGSRRTDAVMMEKAASVCSRGGLSGVGQGNRAEQQKGAR